MSTNAALETLRQEQVKIDEIIETCQQAITYSDLKIRENKRYLKERMEKRAKEIAEAIKRLEEK